MLHLFQFEGRCFLVLQNAAISIKSSELSTRKRHHNCWKTILHARMMLSAQLTSLAPPMPQPQPHHTPTPPDSPTPSQTPNWFQPVARQEARVETTQPLRSTRQRRVSVTVSWPKKRLFTPDIKRMLKSWLIRRRDNPYPSRAEKEALAAATGLTYMQICNWFANWRRKLRKSATSNSATSGTWGRLIKRYNATACAAAEQFSISSDDSIWDADTCSTHFAAPNHDTPIKSRNLTDSEEVSGDCSPPSTAVPDPVRSRRTPRRRRRRRRPPSTAPPDQRTTPILSKWLENAAKSLPWQAHNEGILERRHPAPEELDAAEALTRLSVMIGECHQYGALC